MFCYIENVFYKNQLFYSSKLDINFKFWEKGILYWSRCMYKIFKNYLHSSIDVNGKYFFFVFMLVYSQQLLCLNETHCIDSRFNQNVNLVNCVSLIIIIITNLIIHNQFLRKTNMTYDLSELYFLLIKCISYT